MLRHGLCLILAGMLGCSGLGRDANARATQGGGTLADGTRGSRPFVGARNILDANDGDFVAVGTDVHCVGDSVIQLAQEAGDTDAPDFLLCVFDDGCYAYDMRGFGSSASAMGRVAPAVLEAILDDARSFGFGRFDSELLLAEAFLPDQELMIDLDGRIHTVRFSQLVGSEDVARISELGPVRGMQLSVTYLLASRVLDILGDSR